MFENWLIETWHVLQELAPWLLFGLLVAGFLHVVFPVSYIRRHLGGRGFVNVLKATLVGVPMPLCSCGVIPTGIGLRRDGASDGASVGFLISTPQTGVDSFFVSASMLGWPFALFKVGAAMVTGLVGGVLTDHVAHRHGEVPEAGGEMGFRGRGLRARAAELFRFGFVELLGSIYLWIAIGVPMAGLISALVPEDYFAGMAWMQGLGGMLVMLLIAMPMYVCAVASVPVAASLVAAGMPTGAALVFLMAGPATNIATVGAILKTFGGRVVGIYVGTVAVFSVLLGWLFESVLGGAGAQARAMAHVVPSWVGLAGAIVLMALLLGHAVAQEMARRSRAAAAGPALVLMVSGMTCRNCVATVRRAIGGVEGISGAAVDLKRGTARVSGEGIDVAAVVKAVEDAGYGAEVLDDSNH